MRAYWASMSSRLRWPCTPPPRVEYTALAFDLISFQILWRVLKVGSPGMGLRLALSKRVSLKIIELVMVDDSDDQLSRYVVVSSIKSS